MIQGAKHPPIRATARALSLPSLAAQVQAWMRAWDLSRANQALAVLIGGLALWCVATPLFMRSNIDRLIELAKQRTQPFAISTPLEGLRATEEYASVMQVQDPFRIGSASRVTETLPVEVPLQHPPEPDFSAALQQLKLVGISWVPDPIAMVEDLTTHQTNFLKPGASIGPFTVTEILHDRVMLRAGEKEYELF